MKKQELTFTDEEYEWMEEDRNAFISLFRYMAKTVREDCERRVLVPYIEMQEKDFKIFWSTIDDYAKENCLFLDGFALPFCERTAKMLSEKYGISVYKSDDGQNMYCVPILDRIFEVELLEKKMNKRKLIKDTDDIDFIKEYQQTFVAFLNRKLGRKATDVEILEAYRNDAITEEWIVEAHRIRDEIND